ncbi:MAG: asparaginase [Lachnospiraceae bacterium]|jgi:L-asparaginase|nr:asparaginase [Lachnospiraceae bacterium]
MEEKRILVLTTGGTIASMDGENGLSPERGIDIIGLANVGAGFSVDVHEMFRLDSSNIQPEEWQSLAIEIDSRKNEYDGIVITHGTDTMAYTSSILAYMLRGIEIPVVLTGSQLPADHPLTDAIANLHIAFTFAGSGYPGVFIAFDRKVILATRAVKARTRSFSAFESINQNPIAQADARGLVFNTIIEKTGSYDFKPDLCPDVFLLKLVPGTTPKSLQMLIDAGYKGIVIEAFGAGGLHVFRRNLVVELKKAVEKGVSIVVVSQCLYEPSDFTIYEVGRMALSAGVIEGRDMTSEAAVTKLMWALGNTKTPEEVRTIFNTSLAGEVTLR